jgi:hypothetical protein
MRKRSKSKQLVEILAVVTALSSCSLYAGTLFAQERYDGGAFTMIVPAGSTSVASGLISY